MCILLDNYLAISWGFLRLGAAALGLAGGRAEHLVTTIFTANLGLGLFFLAVCLLK